jgi:hypothetical protein
MLYAANGMSADLVKAHNDLDKAVDAAYGYKPNRSANLSLYSRAADDAARVAFLFERYQQLTAPLIETEKLKSREKE